MGKLLMFGVNVIALLILIEIIFYIFKGKGPLRRYILSPIANHFRNKKQVKQDKKSNQSKTIYGIISKTILNEDNSFNLLKNYKDNEYFSSLSKQKLVNVVANLNKTFMLGLAVIDEGKLKVVDKKNNSIMSAHEFKPSIA